MVSGPLRLQILSVADCIFCCMQSGIGSREVGYLAISDTKGRCLARIHDDKTLTPALQGQLPFLMAWLVRSLKVSLHALASACICCLA